VWVSSTPVSAVPAVAATTQSAQVPVAFTSQGDAQTSSPAQNAVRQRIQQEFVNNVGTQSNPSDPAYLQRWQSAQALADQQYEQQFGTQAFVTHQLAQYHAGAN
jgi:hypothetical protein